MRIQQDTKTQRRHGRNRKFFICTMVCLCLCALVFNTLLLLAAEQRGQVTFAEVPVPGATVTATQGTQTFVAVTDAQSAYVFPDLPNGTWAIQVEMSGFATLKGDNSTTAWELKMLPVEEMRA